MKNWYKEISVYQIWPRSFKDSNGDGIGDLGGVIEKLDYIKNLNVDAIWFSPLYPSPNADYGYDIADYKNISPEYGTLEQFKTLVEEAHKRDLKIIMDLVVNHTSDECEWFKESKKGHDNPYHDYYFWRKGKGKKRPNNWISLFEGKAWKYNEDLDEYYLHVFSEGQPDLNWDNPKVREEVKSILRFWLDLGVDGFREDVITYISKAKGLPNGFPIPAACGMEHYSNGPHLHEYLMEMRKHVLDKYDCFVVGEAPMMTPGKAKKFITEGENQTLDMMFHFQHMEADCLFTDWVHMPFNLRKLKKVYSNWQKKLYKTAWNALYIENHDHPRIINRYGSLKYRVESGKMLAAMYILQSGTPFIYQGQEIGMTNITLDSFDQFKDVLTFNNYRMFKGLGLSDEKILKITNRATRENSRTPVQWKNEENGGFTTGTPWFNVNPNYTEINVEDADKDPNSILNFYRKLLKFRKENPVVIYGDYKEHNKCSNKIYVYERNYEGKRLLVISSFTEKAVKFKAPKGFDLASGKLVLQNYDDASIINNGFTLKPYETRVYLW